MRSAPVSQNKFGQRVITPLADPGGSRPLTPNRPRQGNGSEVDKVRKQRTLKR